MSLWFQGLKVPRVAETARTRDRTRAHETGSVRRQQWRKQIRVLFADPAQHRIAKALQTIQAVADSKHTVLLRGESGTGKECCRTIGSSSDGGEISLHLLNARFAGIADRIFGAFSGTRKGAFPGADPRAQEDRVAQ